MKNLMSKFSIQKQKFLNSFLSAFYYAYIPILLFLGIYIIVRIKNSQLLIIIKRYEPMNK